jgi:tetratricopeptide (TPR) repeat protein
MAIDALDTEEVLREWDGENPDALVEMGIQATAQGSYERGLIFLSEAYRRLSKERDAKHPAALLSHYGLCLALHRGRIREAVEFCQLAIEREFYNGDNYFNLARVFEAGRSRRKMIDAIERGLSVDARHVGLLKMKVLIGIRRPPVVPFLHRDHPLNVSLGRLRHQMKGKVGVKKKGTSAKKKP